MTSLSPGKKVCDGPVWQPFSQKRIVDSTSKAHVRLELMHSGLGLRVTRWKGIQTLYPPPPPHATISQDKRIGNQNNMRMRR